MKYVNLPKRFVAGTVYLRDAGPNDAGECAAACEVVLRGAGLERRARTNFFGDFEFEDLPEDAIFEVIVSGAGYKPVSLRAETAKDVYLGDIYLVSG